MAKDTPPYNAETDLVQIFSVDDIPKAAMYFSQITGRPKGQTQFTWEEGPLSLEGTMHPIQQLVGHYHNVKGYKAMFGLVFPHVITMWVWGPNEARGTNLYRPNLLNTKDLAPIDAPPHGTQAFVGCLLENLVVGQETVLWARSKSVGDYFAQERSTDLSISMVNPTKLDY